MPKGLAFPAPHLPAPLLPVCTTQLAGFRRQISGHPAGRATASESVCVQLAINRAQMKTDRVTPISISAAAV
jgi:hypothetical protein